MQIGRYDASPSASSKHLSWQERDLSSALSEAFAASGFTVSEKVIILLAIANVEKAISNAKGGVIAPRLDPEDEVDELFPAVRYVSIVWEAEHK